MVERLRAANKYFEMLTMYLVYDIMDLFYFSKEFAISHLPFLELKII